MQEPEPQEPEQVTAPDLVFSLTLRAAFLQARPEKRLHFLFYHLLRQRLEIVPIAIEYR